MTYGELDHPVLPKVGPHPESSPGTSSKASHLHGKVFPIDAVF